MMLFKLSVRNLKKSMRDYMIYFATLILGVAIFYVFNAIESQTIMMNVSKNTHDIIKLMNSTLSVVSVFVSFVLGFLIVYASNFLMKRRKKEFGIYMLLGMSKRNISMIIVIETILIGTISLVAGIILGIAVSQGMSIVTVNMFEADMKDFTFIISYSAIVKTIAYFLVMYVIVILMDVIVVGRAKLINLINAGRKSEKNVAKNPLICLIVFTIACVLLGTAYYNVTAGIGKMVTEYDIVIQIVKGIVATFMLFWSVSGLILYIVKKIRKVYFKGLNNFTIKELGSRINTTVFSGGIICLMLFMTICVLSSAMSVKKSLNDNLKKMTPVDVDFEMSLENVNVKKAPSIQEVFRDKGIDMSLFKDRVEISSYYGKMSLKDTLGEYVQDSKFDDEMYKNFVEMKEEIIKLSDYNKLAKLYGLEEYSLEDNQYMIIANYDSMIEMRNEGLKRNTQIKIGGKQYNPRYAECKNGYIVMAANNINMGVIIVPDNADLSTLQICENYFMANYNGTESEIEKTKKYIDSEKFNKKINSDNRNYPQIIINSKTLIYENSVGITAMIVFIGMYLGIVFIISSAAILALKELSDASDNREKYCILRKIGVDEKRINKSLRSQCAMFFGFPLLIAVLHSVFGIQTCLYILETIGRTGLLYSIITTGAMILVIYGGYFLITYYCSKKIIE